MRSRLTKLLALIFALALISAACGSSGSDATSDDATSAGDTSAEDASTDEASDDEASDDEMSEDEMSDDEMSEDEMADDEAAAGDLECAVENLPLFTDGTLTIATGEPVYPPWMIDDDPANGEGFESAVAYALAEEMGFAQEDVVWVRTDFDVAITPGDKEYDFNMQQYSPLPVRDEVVDFSVPYYRSSKSVLAVGSSPAVGAATIADLQAATWGATIGTTDLTYIESVLGIEDVAVYDTQADTVAAMMAGQIDATVIALPSALYLSAVELDDGVIAGVLPATGDNEDGEAMSLLFTEGSPLTSCVNVALESLTADGTLDALAATWLQGDGDIPNITE